MTRQYSLNELESAINYWRNRSPSVGEEQALCKEAAALAEPYALMIFYSHTEIPATAMSPEAQKAMADWEATRKSGSTQS
ncbi:MAG TPA: DUF3717 domain-containing protein [Pusillimonas sp.]|uniref:DUF3717 domain-containing protein n=1 Tax=Pusillimonas sp. TaxID=3040095 RepID=UPI002B4B35AD|nr:DUF3717 domain-containing protein [Pusillimonas sp.]HLU19979.1 DUF3717 domain-containing protein [Pusillimonas sp.]